MIRLSYLQILKNTFTLLLRLIVYRLIDAAVEISLRRFQLIKMSGEMNVGEMNVGEMNVGRIWGELI